MSLNNRFPLKHGETVPPLSALCLVVRANYGTASTTEWSTSGHPPSKNTCITSGSAWQQMALWNSRCQFITLKIGELSRFGCLSHCTLTKLSCFILNSCRTYLTFVISKCVWNVFLYFVLHSRQGLSTEMWVSVTGFRRQILQITDAGIAIVWLAVNASCELLASSQQILTNKEK